MMSRRGAALVLALLCAACGGGGGDGDGGGSGGGGGGNGGGGQNTPTPGASTSVCGGAITSTPKLCALTPHDAGVVGNTRYLSFSFCMSDLEGDVDKLCVGVAIGGGTPALRCSYLSPGSSTVNGCAQTDPIAVGTRGVIATWKLAMDVGDTAGHVSNVVSTTFSCCQ